MNRGVWFMRPNVRAKRHAEADADWPRKDDTHRACSGQAVAAVACPRLSEWLGLLARAQRTGRPRQASEGGIDSWRRVRDNGHLRTDSGTFLAALLRRCTAATNNWCRRRAASSKVRPQACVGQQAGRRE